MKITPTDKEISFTFSRFKKRSNPYDEGDYGEYPFFTGLIIRHRKDGNNWDEMGFAQTIDRDYKGKDDDVGDFVIKWHESESDFKKMCSELKIGLSILEIGDF